MNHRYFRIITFAALMTLGAENVDTLASETDSPAYQCFERANTLSECLKCKSHWKYDERGFWLNACIFDKCSGTEYSKAMTCLERWQRLFELFEQSYRDAIARCRADYPEDSLQRAECLRGHRDQRQKNLDSIYSTLSECLSQRCTPITPTTP